MPISHAYSLLDENIKNLINTDNEWVYFDPKIMCNK